MVAQNSCRLRKFDTNYKRTKAMEKEHLKEEDPNKSTTHANMRTPTSKN